MNETTFSFPLALIRLPSMSFTSSPRARVLLVKSTSRATTSVPLTVFDDVLVPLSESGNVTFVQCYI